MEPNPRQIFSRDCSSNHDYLELQPLKMDPDLLLFGSTPAPLWLSSAPALTKFLAISKQDFILFVGFVSLDCAKFFALLAKYAYPYPYAPVLAPFQLQLWLWPHFALEATPFLGIFRLEFIELALLLSRIRTFFHFLLNKCT